VSLGPACTQFPVHRSSFVTMLMHQRGLDGALCLPIVRFFVKFAKSVRVRRPRPRKHATFVSADTMRHTQVGVPALPHLRTSLPAVARPACSAAHVPRAAVPIRGLSHGRVQMHDGHVVWDLKRQLGVQWEPPVLAVPPAAEVERDNI